jgi:hypothetical protein
LLKSNQPVEKGTIISTKLSTFEISPLERNFVKLF